MTGNAQELEQVFINLFVNASQAMPKNRMGSLRVVTRLNDKTIEISVEDDGPGIPAELLNKIWDPFFTTKGIGDGTGLGLAITQGIVERHSGRITAENRPGGGARFLLRLPAAERTAGNGGTDPGRG